MSIIAKFMTLFSPSSHFTLFDGIPIFLIIILIGYTQAEMMLITAQCESRCIYQMNSKPSQPSNLFQKLIKLSNPLPSQSQTQSIGFDSQSGHVNTNGYYKQCYQDQGCLTCAKPCSQPFSEFQTCIDHCKILSSSEQEPCMSSCSFLRDITINKVGTCPSIQQMSGFALACIDSCHKDSDCNGIQKCCPHRCGRTCQYAETINEEVPPKPSLKYVTKDEKPDNEGRTVIHLAWKMPLTTTRPVNSGTINMEKSWLKTLSEGVLYNASSILYVVQSQLNIESSAATTNPGSAVTANSNNRISEWKDLAITNNLELTIKEYLPTSWIRFRVASINPNGTLGFSDPSNVINIKSGISSPQMPRNLTIGEHTVKRNGKISQIIHWSTPKSDLPIIKYKIVWSSQSYNREASSSSNSLKNGKEGKNLQELRQFKRIVSGTSTSFTIDDLVPDTTYFIQVQGYSQKGPLKFKGERASIFLTTPNTNLDYDGISKTKKLLLLNNVKRISAPGKQQISSENYKKGDELKVVEDQILLTTEAYYDEYYIKTTRDMTEDSKISSVEESMKIKDNKNHHHPANINERLRKDIKLINISIGQPYIEEGTMLLKAKLQWVPLLNDKSVEISNVEIRYKVVWHPLVCIENSKYEHIYDSTQVTISYAKRDKKSFQEKGDTAESGHHPPSQIKNTLNFKRRDTTDQGTAGGKFNQNHKRLKKSGPGVGEHSSTAEKVDYTTEPNRNDIVLYNLRYKCRYGVRIYPFIDEEVKKKGQQQSTASLPTSNSENNDDFSINFQTPSCQEIQLLHPEQLDLVDCPILIPAPTRPRNLTSHLVYMGGKDNITALISWRPPPSSSSSKTMLSIARDSDLLNNDNDRRKTLPTSMQKFHVSGRKIIYDPLSEKTLLKNRVNDESSEKDDSNVIGYRLVFYGKRKNGNTDVSRRYGHPGAREDNAGHNIFIKVFSPFQTSFYITDLLYDRDYAVDVQAFSEGGPGSVAHIEFRTPKEIDENRLSKSEYYGVYPRIYGRNRNAMGTASLLRHNRQKSGFTNFKEPTKDDQNLYINNENNNDEEHVKKNYDILSPQQGLVDHRQQGQSPYYSSYYYKYMPTRRRTLFNSNGDRFAAGAEAAASYKYRKERVQTSDAISSFQHIRKPFVRFSFKNLIFSSILIVFLHLINIFNRHHLF